MTVSNKVRLDRLGSIYLFHPLVRALNRDVERVPILMYHGVRDESESGHPYYQTNTSPAVFAGQMQYLRDNGYEVLDLAEASRSLELGESKGRRVVITFDDGYKDFYANAYPILRDYGFTATVFVISGITGEAGLRFKRHECMTWQEVREIKGNGIGIGSHTATHPQLKTLSKAGIDREIGWSKQMIEDKLGHSITSFSYPFAFPKTQCSLVAFVGQTLLKYGYREGVSTVIGTASSRSARLFLPRLPVNDWDDIRLFRAKLEGGYDWLYIPQTLAKLVRRGGRDLPVGKPRRTKSWATSQDGG